MGWLPDVETRTAYINWLAPQLGVDPATALSVVRREGLTPGTWQSGVVKNGVREPSYGDFQLYTRGGLGNRAAKEWGYDVTNPQNWMLNDAYGLLSARRGGWEPWYGAKYAGVHGFTGINRNAPIPNDVKALALSYTGSGQQPMQYDPYARHAPGVGPMVADNYGGQQQTTGTPEQPPPDQVSRMLQNLINNRMQPPQRQGILGPAIMMALAGAASRIPGPLGGLGAGLAGGLARGMRSRGDIQDENYQRQAQALQLMMKMREWQQQQAGTYSQVEGAPPGTMRHDQPGAQPHWDTIPPYPGYQPPVKAPPQIDPTKPIVNPDGSISYPPIGGTQPPNPKAEQEATEASIKQRKELLSLWNDNEKDAIANYQGAQSTWESALDLAQQGTPAADKALVTQWQKLQNPRSVRFNSNTGEDQIVSFANLDDRWKNTISYLLGGSGKLTGDQRMEVLNSIRPFMTHYVTNYTKARDRFAKVAAGYGYTKEEDLPPAAIAIPEKITPEMVFWEPNTGPKTQQPTGVDQVKQQAAAMAAQGKSREEIAAWLKSQGFDLTE